MGNFVSCSNLYLLHASPKSFLAATSKAALRNRDKDVCVSVGSKEGDGVKENKGRGGIG